MTEVTTLRLWLLRAMYLIIAGGLALVIWPTLVSHDAGWPLMNSVVGAMLGAVSLLALLGLRYPVRMIPLLLFELVWKALWLVAVGLPLWLADAIDPRTAQTVFDCALGVVLVPLVLPWGHVWRTYVRRPMEPLRAG